MNSSSHLRSYKINDEIIAELNDIENVFRSITRKPSV